MTHSSIAPKYSNDAKDMNYPGYSNDAKDMNYPVSPNYENDTIYTNYTNCYK